MKIRFKRPVLLLSLLTLAVTAQAQSGGLSTAMLTGLFAVALLILLVVIILVSDIFMGEEARKVGADKTGENYTLFPNLSEITKPRDIGYAKGEFVTRLKRGHDIRLEGEAQKVLGNARVNTVAISPRDFIGMSPIPKVLVEKDDEIKAGDILFFDKKRPTIKYASPVSGQVVDVLRGEKRAIDKIVILADKEQQYTERTVPKLNDFNSREDLVNYLTESGVWAFIRQRPFELVADPTDVPRDIFISTFDSAPLAPDTDFALKNKATAFQRGLDVLNKLTEGKVHLGLNASGENPPSLTFTRAQNVEKHWFNGPHPAGNVGVQIHHIAPINKGDVVWVVNPQDVAIIGNLFVNGQYRAERTIAVTGAEVREPKYYTLPVGASVENILKNNIKTENKTRTVAGDVLTGTKIANDGYLGFFDDQITVLHENDEYELFGWMNPVAVRPSVSSTFPGSTFKDITYQAETNTHGEPRALVVTGQYESVLPMDVYPQHLIKAILANDFERMEGLGIYELAPEDVALCEFACTSKTNVQNILRQGLDTVREQG